MAGWELHMNMANEIIKRCGSKRPKEFLLGSVIPDCPWWDTQTASVSGGRDRMHLYSQRNGKFGGEAGVTDWVIKNERWLRTYELYKGQLTHILLDYELNTIWNVACLVEEFDMIVYPNGRRVTQEEAGLHKWAEVTEYNARRYGESSCWFAYPDDKEKAETCGLLKDHYGLTNEELTSMFNRIDDTLNDMYKERNKNIEFLIPITSYERVIGIVISRYMSIIDTMRIK